MTHAKLVSELDAIGHELDAILLTEQAAAADLERRFTEEQAALGKLLVSVQEARTAGQWRATRFNTFDVLGRPRLEQAPFELSCLAS
jgi:hypothetical protein